jgi:hypothetical protein
MILENRVNLSHGNLVLACQRSRRRSESKIGEDTLLARTSGIVAIWRSQGFDDFRAKTRSEMRAFLEVVRITKNSIEYM